MFDPNKSFFELFWVKIFGYGLPLIAFLSATAIFVTGDYGFSPTAAGFNQFLTDFKFPIGVLAMLIPVMALLATNHRSEQTKAQIKAAESHNNFVNYFKHMEEFEKYADICSVTIESVRSFYAVVFPNARDGDYRVSVDAVNEIDILAGQLIDVMEALKNNTDEPDFEYFYICCKAIEDGISEAFHIKTNIKDSDVDFRFYISEDLIEKYNLFVACYDAVCGIDKLMRFDNSYSSSITMEKAKFQFIAFDEVFKECSDLTLKDEDFLPL